MVNNNHHGKPALTYGYQPDEYDDYNLPDRLPADEGDYVPRRWRQWYASSMEVEATPLEVELPKRRRWGRFMYLAIVILGLLLGLDFIAGHVFWYSAKGSVGGNQYQLSPTSIATVKTIAVKPGDKVHKGQLLMSFDSPQFSQTLAETKAKIADLESNMQDTSNTQASTAASLRGEISGLQAQYQALRQEYQSQQQQIDSMASLAAKGALNYGDVRQLQQQAMQTKAEYSQIYAKIESDRAQLKHIHAATKGGKSTMHDRLAALKQLRQSLHARMQSLTLKAPVAGVVAQVPVTTGQTVKPGDTAVVVAPSGDQRTLLYFPPAARTRLAKGQELPVTTPNGTHIKMRIAHIYPSIQALPDDLQSRVDHSGPVLVVVARPVNPQDIQKLPAGTPVNSQVPRWQAGQWIGHWVSEAGQAITQWI